MINIIYYLKCTQITLANHFYINLRSNIIMDKKKSVWHMLIHAVNHRAKNIFTNPPSKANITWFYKKYLKHLPPNNLHYHKLLNHKTYFHGGPEYLHGIQEIFIDETYLQNLPQNAFILDCGANIGLSVIYLKAL